MDERPFSELSLPERMERLAAMAASGDLSVRVSAGVTDEDFRAMTDTVLAVLQAAPQTDRYRSFYVEVIQEAISCGVYRAAHETDPRVALDEIIDWHGKVALDPAVSAEARALIERGQDKARSQENDNG